MIKLFTRRKLFLTAIELPRKCASFHDDDEKEERMKLFSLFANVSMTIILKRKMRFPRGHQNSPQFPMTRFRSIFLYNRVEQENGVSAFHRGTGNDNFLLGFISEAFRINFTFDLRTIQFFAYFYTIIFSNIAGNRTYGE